MVAPGRYSKIHRRIWNDEKFRSLSKPQPCGQFLWLRLLSGPELGPIPGLFQAREPGLADALNWPLEPFRESFRELVRNGIAKADWEAGLVWVPNAVLYNAPANPNVVTSWSDAWSELPECKLKSEAFARLCTYLGGRGESFLAAFRNGCPNHSPNHCPNQDQDQEQEQEQENPPSARASACEPRSKIRPREAHDLILCLKIAVEREQPERGQWAAEPFGHKNAQEFLCGFDDIEAALATLEQRIDLFAKDPEMQPWTVRKFTEKYNAIGLPKSPLPQWRKDIRVGSARAEIHEDAPVGKQAI